MTLTGLNRDRYAAHVGDLDARPSRFVDPHEYAQWCARADIWAALSGLTVTTWADGYGNWHARIPANAYARPADAARRAITRELEARAPRTGVIGTVYVARVCTNTDGSTEYIERF